MASYSLIIVLEDYLGHSPELIKEGKKLKAQKDSIDDKAELAKRNNWTTVIMARNLLKIQNL